MADALSLQIIDLLATVHCLLEVRTDCIEALQEVGYTYLQEYEAWLPDELLFRRAVSGVWTHHLHIMHPASPRWEEFIFIRDYLRGHADSTDAYADLKRALALVFEDDIAGYRNAKRPFLQVLLAKARVEKLASA